MEWPNGYSCSGGGSPVVATTVVATTFCSLQRLESGEILLRNQSTGFVSVCERLNRTSMTVHTEDGACGAVSRIAQTTITVISESPPAPLSTFGKGYTYLVVYRPQAQMRQIVTS